METTDEELFKKLHLARAVHSVEIHILQAVKDGQREQPAAYIFFQLQNLDRGFICTKRGEHKSYLVSTALRFLHSVGYRSVMLQMGGCDVGQMGLPFENTKV